MKLFLYPLPLMECGGGVQPLPIKNYKWNGFIVLSLHIKEFSCMDSSLAGGLKNLFRRIIFSIHGHVKWFLKIVFLCSEEIIVIGYNLVSFLHNFMENISFLTKCNVLFNNENLILIWFFLFIDNEFDLKITLRILNQKIIKYINENPQNVVIFKIVFSIMVAELYWQAFKDDLQAWMQSKAPGTRHLVWLY